MREIVDAQHVLDAILVASKMVDASNAEITTRYVDVSTSYGIALLAKEKAVLTYEAPIKTKPNPPMF